MGIRRGIQRAGFAATWPRKLACALVVCVAGGAAFFLLRALANPTSASGLSVVGAAHRVVRWNSREPLTVEFTLHNSTADSIEIKKVHTGCSCVTSNLDGKIVPPGESAVLQMTVDAFDAYKSDFHQDALVETQRGSLSVSVSGTLPRSSKVLFRPQVLVIGREADLQRTITLRIPRHCSGPLTAADVQLIGFDNGGCELRPRPDTANYREYVVTLRIESAAGQGLLRIVTACEQIEIPIRATG